MKHKWWVETHYNTDGSAIAWTGRCACGFDSGRVMARTAAAVRALDHVRTARGDRPQSALNAGAKIIHLRERAR